MTRKKFKKVILKKSPDYLKKNKWMLEIGGLRLFFQTIKEAEDYFKAYCT